MVSAEMELLQGVGLVAQAERTAELGESWLLFVVQANRIWEVLC